jgi:preprotein translocase subunit YajC
MNNLNIILMMGQQGGTSGGGSAFGSLFFLVLIFVVFYFFFIRPQMKRQKDSKKYRESLQKGQKVVTIGGIHGKIIEIQETTVTLEVEGGMRLRMEKSAIAMDAQDQIGTENK